LRYQCMPLRIRWWRRSRGNQFSVLRFAAGWCRIQPALLWDTDLGNLVDKAGAGHTRFTYHRTWETGLGAAIRVTAFSPDFLVPGFLRLIEPAGHYRMPLRQSLQNRKKATELEPQRIRRVFQQPELSRCACLLHEAVQDVILVFPCAGDFAGVVDAGD